MFLEANSSSAPRVMFEEKCEVRRTDNIQAQISVHFFFKFKWRRPFFFKFRWERKYLMDYKARYLLPLLFFPFIISFNIFFNTSDRKIGEYELDIFQV